MTRFPEIAIPEGDFIKLCQELSETLAIGWITDRRIDAPITTLSREGDVIKNIINWLAEI